MRRKMRKEVTVLKGTGEELKRIMKALKTKLIS